MLTITLLGTAATMPLPDRALTAALAECGGHALLFDCGEGTQAAARRAGVNLMKPLTAGLTRQQWPFQMRWQSILRVQNNPLCNPFLFLNGCDSRYLIFGKIQKMRMNPSQFQSASSEL